MTRSVQRPRFVAVVGVLCTLLLGVGALQLRFDASYRTYFDADDPMLVAFDAVSHRFDPNDALLILVAAQPGRSIYSPDGLRLVRELTSGAERLPQGLHVDSLTNFPRMTDRDCPVKPTQLAEWVARIVLQSPLM